jgi:hypothetical protein
MDYREHFILMPLIFASERRHPDVQYRKDKITAKKRRFALEERFELEPTMGAGDSTWGHDGNAKSRFVDRPLDFFFPERAMGDCGRVLPQPNFAPELQTQFIVDARPQSRQGSARMLVVTARIAEKADKLRKIRQ